MNVKKFAAGMTAMLCCAGVLSYLPPMPAKTYATELVSNDFEANYDGWYGNADAVKLTAKYGVGVDGSRGMLVTGRTSLSDGASSSKGLYLEGGKDYNYSVEVYSPTDEVFHLSLLCLDEETDEQTIVELDSKAVKAGEWTTLSANYKAPENSYEFRLTITTESTNDFAFDNVKVTGKKNNQTVYAATAEKGLKDEFADYFRVGNILNSGTIRNSAITANIIKDYNSIECENETKPDATMVQSQSSGTNVAVSLNRCAAIMDFCVKNQIGMRGHTLVWHSQSPEWVFKEGFNASGAYVNSATMDARMESYIKNLFNAIKTQYPDLNLYAYDVANECVSDDSNRTRNNGGAREPGYGNGKSPWVQIYGSNSFVEKAFIYARKYAPEGCDLYYNDYNEYWDHKRDCIYNMCKSLYEKGLLDGVGMQSHINADASGFSGTANYITAMKKYLSIGCDVQITELDISTESGKFTAQQQADKYKALFQAAMDWNKNPSSDGRVTAVCIWGPNDANTWIKSENTPLLYDTNNQPKLAYTTLTSMIPRSEWGDGTKYTGEVKPVEPDANGWYFHSTFEGDLDSWEGRGAAEVMTSGRTAYAGGEALLVQSRTAAWNGASRTLNTRAFQPGNAYSFSANVMYFDGNDTDTFFMKLQYTDANGDTQYSTVAEGHAIKGQWIQLSNTNYTIPADASNLQLYIETAETSNNFYVDEAIGAVAGTVIEGAGEGKTVIRGDLNFDGKINGADLALERRGLIKGFTDNYAKLAADVNQDGDVTVADAVLIQSFLIGKIKEFPIETRPIDTVAMEKLFAGVTPATSFKKDGENNPLFTQRFGADPGWMEYNGRIYVYTTNDAFEYDSNGKMKENSYNVGTINCLSSADLVNWTDHGAIPVAGRNGRTTNGAAKWASCSWAPDACHKTINGKEKFFLYFANNGSGIGVLTADSPTGPWTDPIGKELISRSTPNCGNVTWLFDPGVYYDEETGKGYLAFGGGVPDGKSADPGTARIVELGSDMTSIVGTPTTLNPPYLFEDSSLIKINGTWVYSFCHNWSVPAGQKFNSADIGYMTATNPLGPYTYQGPVFRNTGAQGLDNNGNNHHSIIEFKGKYYVLYHTRQLEIRMGVNGGKGYNYRSPSISEATVNGTSITCRGSHTGVKQIESLNPYTTVQAETMSNQSQGIAVNGLSDTTVTGTKGSWTKVSGVNFSNGAKTLTVKACSKSGAVIKVCTGGTNGDVVTYAEIKAGSTPEEITVPVVNSVSGNKDLYFVFSGDVTFDSWSFS